MTGPAKLAIAEFVVLHIIYMFGQTQIKQLES